MKRNYLGVSCVAASSTNLRNGFVQLIPSGGAANSIGDRMKTDRMKTGRSITCLDRTLKSVGVG